MNPANDIKFSSLGTPRRIWAISAVHAEAGRLMDVHDELYSHIGPGDRLVYLGNYIGNGETPTETIDEILAFRRSVLSIPGMQADDITYLRGSQEEMWQKLLQIQFAPNPTEILTWLLGNGLSSSLKGYGISPEEGLMAAREGIMSLTKWTNKIRCALRRLPGHEIFSTQTRRAAYTDKASEFPMLFVHTGIDSKRPLHDQGDNFWWASDNFNKIEIPYNPFQKVVRGFDPAHNGLHLNCITATIDGGCGFGGSLVCAGFDPDGDIFELFEA